VACRCQSIAVEFFIWKNSEQILVNPRHNCKCSATC
jgi:hypothetical protein